MDVLTKQEILPIIICDLLPKCDISLLTRNTLCTVRNVYEHVTSTVYNEENDTLPR